MPHFNRSISAFVLHESIHIHEGDVDSSTGGNIQNPFSSSFPTVSGLPLTHCNVRGDVVQMPLNDRIEDPESEVADIRPEIHHHERLCGRNFHGRLNGHGVFAVYKYFVVSQPLSLTRNFTGTAEVKVCSRLSRPWRD